MTCGDEVDKMCCLAQTGCVWLARLEFILHAVDILFRYFRNARSKICISLTCYEYELIAKRIRMQIEVSCGRLEIYQISVTYSRRLYGVALFPLRRDLDCEEKSSIISVASYLA